jgi:D-amino-acid dehydrogenase
VRDTASGESRSLRGDAVVVACGSYSAPLLRTVGVDLPIYPGKGYSATFKLLRPKDAPSVSTIDDEVKCAMSRLGNELRVAGTIELGGYDLSLDTPLARARCRMLAQRIEQVLPGVCDTRTRPKAATRATGPACALPRPPTSPTSAAPAWRLWVNAGHGTLGWTHGAGSGKAMAELISGELLRSAERTGVHQGHPWVV